MLVDSRSRAVDCLRRDAGQWVIAPTVIGQGTIQLASLGLSLTLDTIYADVDVA